MTKSTILRFVRAQARRDAQYRRTASVREIEMAVAGYTSCRAFFGLDTPILREPTIQKAVATYKSRRGALLLLDDHAALPKRVRKPKATLMSPVMPGLKLGLRSPRKAKKRI